MRTSQLALVALLLAAPAAAEPPRPTKATRALLRDLVAGRVAWSAVVDPAAGVLDLGYRTGDFDGDHRWGRRRCDATFLRGLRGELRASIDADEHFRCENRGDRATCWIGDAGEWARTRRFEFRVGPDGLVLEAVVELNSIYNPKDEARVVAALRRRAAAATCRP